MKNWLTTLPAALALTGGFLWFPAPAAFADCFTMELRIRVGGGSICGYVVLCPANANPGATNSP